MSSSDRFILKPFSENEFTRAFTIEGVLTSLEKEHCEIDFLIRGNLHKIDWGSDALLSPQQRQHELWKSTCLEFFLAPLTSAEAPYYEVNASPRGAWNLYHFDSYRSGMREVPQGQVHLQLLTETPSERRYRILVHLPGGNLYAGALGLCWVLKDLTGEVSYWALSHPKPQPDFHAKEAWIDCAHRAE